MTTESKIKLAAGMATALLFASLFGIAVLTNTNSELHSSIGAEKLKSESLLSEKLSLDKQLKTFKNEIASLKGTNTELDRFLAEAQQKIREKENAIAKLTQENTGMRALRKEHEEIKRMRKDLYIQLEKLKNENTSLTAQIGQLNGAIASLDQEKNELQAQLANAKNNMIATNFMVAVRKKKEEKLTVRAKRTHSLAISFDLPAGGAQTMNNFYRVDVVSPSGALIKGEVKETQVQKTNNFTASAINIAAKTEKDNVALIFAPEEKLAQGIYTIIIYNGNQYLGSAQVKLTK